MAKMMVVEAMLAMVAAGDVSCREVLEDAIREGVEDAPRGVRYELVASPTRRWQGTDIAEKVTPNHYAVVTEKRSIRLVGAERTWAPCEEHDDCREDKATALRCSRESARMHGWDRTFEVGDVAEYDSFNLSYSGRIASIGKRITIAKNDMPNRSNGKVATAVLDVYSFELRNRDFDAAKAAARNSDAMMYL